MYRKLGELEAEMYLTGAKHSYKPNKFDVVRVYQKGRFMKIYNEIVSLITDKKILESLEIKKRFIETETPPKGIKDGFVLLHGDLTPENIFWEKKEVSAIIDFDSAQIEHPYFHILRNIRITLAIDGYGKEFQKRLKRVSKSFFYRY